MLGSYLKVLPPAVIGLQLMHSAIIGVEEVTSVRDALCAGWLQAALGPSRRTQPSTVLSEFTDMINCINHTVFDTGWPRWYQPPAAGYFLLAHVLLDAVLAQKVPLLFAQKCHATKPLLSQPIVIQ